MAEIESNCTRCGGILKVFFGDRCIGGKLVWYESHRCDECGSAMEVDGEDELPDELRSIVLNQHGEWCLIVLEGKKSSIGKVLRSAKALDMKEVSQLLASFPGVLFSGTRAEMDVIKYHLDREGINSIVEQY